MNHKVNKKKNNSCNSLVFGRWPQTKIIVLGGHTYGATLRLYIKLHEKHNQKELPPNSHLSLLNKQTQTQVLVT